jgi:urate oxidase
MVTRRTEEAKNVVNLVENRYGKSRVRLVRVKRHADRHDFSEWQVEVLLRGDFASCFEEGDNSKILATDTMKNTVYSLVRDSSAACMEDFAMELIDFLLSRNPQVSKAEVMIQEKPWEHLNVRGKAHPTTFVNCSTENQTTTISRSQNSTFSIVSGLENLVIMKTAGSAFEGFIRDPLTTLPESSDRLFGTAMWANWTYNQGQHDYPALRGNVRETLLEVFANHQSKSVQHTLYAMAQRVLETIVEVEDLELTMPNKHCLLVDLSRFGQDNPNEIFVPIDEPHGYIEARVRRQR